MPVPRSILTREPITDLDLAVVAGTWPDDVTGEVVISTGDPATAGAFALFGDGLAIRCSLRPGMHGAPADRFAWRVRPVETPSRRLRARRPGDFTATGIGTLSPFGAVNIANTAPLPWGDRLFVTSDAGRPVELDPVTLGFLAEVGHRADWVEALPQPVLPLILSSAHPVVDPDRGCLWTVVRDLGGTVHVVRWSGEGPHVERWPIDGVTFPCSNHTITQTRDWLVVSDTPFVVDPGTLAGQERTALPFPTQPVALVRKDALAATTPGTPVAAAVFTLAPVCHHFYARYDDRDGVRVLWEHSEGFDLADHLQPGDVDLYGRPVDPALHGLFAHHLAPARVTEMAFDPERGAVTGLAEAFAPERWWATILSGIDWSAEGQAHPEVHHQIFGGYHPDAIPTRTRDRFGDRIGALPPDELPAVLVTLDRDTLRARAEHTFAADDYPTSPVFVPRDPGAPGRSRYAGSRPGGADGWVLVAVHHDLGLRLELFDAADIGRGPVAVLADPGRARMPFLLHSAWMPQAIAAGDDPERLRFSDEVADRLGGLTDEQAQAVRDVSEELDT